jgi:hypothetical protein
MVFFCVLNRHFNDGAIIENGGARFSKCRSCGIELVEKNGRWGPVPKGFRIVWRPRAPEAASPPAMSLPSGSIPGEDATEGLVEANSTPLPVIVEEPRKRDRRQGNAKAFFGPERRRSDRRARFGKVETLVERDGIRITRDGAAFPSITFLADDIVRVEVTSNVGKVSLTWLVYGALSALTFLQAALTGDLGLWAIGAALALIASLKWQRRQRPDLYDIMVETRAGLCSVLQTADRAFATLIHDAMDSIRTPARTGPVIA